MHLACCCGLPTRPLWMSGNGVHISTLENFGARTGIAPYGDAPMSLHCCMYSLLSGVKGLFGTCLCAFPILVYFCHNCHAAAVAGLVQVSLAVKTTSALALRLMLTCTHLKSSRMIRCAHVQGHYWIDALVTNTTFQQKRHYFFIFYFYLFVPCLAVRHPHQV